MERFTSDHTLLNIIVAFALLAFLGSLLGSFLMHFKMTMMQRPDEGEKFFQETADWVIFWMSFMGFVSGLLCLMVVAWLNFFNALPAWLIGLAGLAMIAYAGYVLWKRIQGIRSDITNV